MTRHRLPNPVSASRGLDLSDRRLIQLAEDHLFPRPVRGEYELLPTILGLVTHYRALANKKSDSLAAEHLRKTKEEADKLALENEKTRGGLVEIEAVYRHFEGLFIAFRARILSSGLDDNEKDELLNDLRGLKGRDFSEPLMPNPKKPRNR